MVADKVALVTGAASGIGLATAIRFAELGHAVVLADVDVERLPHAAEAVERAGAPGHCTIHCDVSVREDAVTAADLAVSRFGRLDVVVNNAGLMDFSPIERLGEAEVQRVLGVNLVGPLWFIQQAFARCRPGSCVVNVSSVHAVQTSPGVAAYAMAKAGLLGLTRAAAIEGKPKGIRVNAVIVGAVETPMLRGNPNIASGVEVLDPSMVGQPRDVAGAIAFLASSDAAFIDGALLQVDGGRLARL